MVVTYQGGIYMKKAIAASVMALGLVLAPATAANAAPADKVAPVTPATQFHGLPGNNAGFSNQVKGAAPAGTAPGADGGIHGIANNPGQSGVSPQDRNTPPACDLHGGLGAANKNCN